MTETDIRPVTGTGTIEGVHHLHCGLCYPVKYPGMRAICGAELLGIPPVFPDRCQVCIEQHSEHYKSLHSGG